jgi:predicted metal-binding protein
MVKALSFKKKNNHLKFNFILRQEEDSMDSKKLEKELKKIAHKNNAEIHSILPSQIVVSEWVRWKCQFGCKGYAKHLSCPPYVPGPAETKKLLKEYKKAYLVHFNGIPGMEGIDPDSIPVNWHPFLKGLIIWIHDTMYTLEQAAFYQGCYKALAFAAYPCIYCDDCVSELSSGVVDISLKRDCRHAEKVRTSMEAAGIDVFTTVKKLKLPINVVPCKDNEYGRIMHTDLNSYGLLLVY